MKNDKIANLWDTREMKFNTEDPSKDPNWPYGLKYACDLFRKMNPWFYLKVEWPNK